MNRIIALANVALLCLGVTLSGAAVAQTANLTESESRGPPLLRINYAVRFGHQQGGAGMNLRLVDRSKSRFAAYVLIRP